MAGIDDTETIDLVAQAADGTYLLVMIEERRWGADKNQAADLKAKINTYLGYMLDGNLFRDFPETLGKPVCIRLDCTERPTGQFAHITSHAAEQLAFYHIGFEINPVN